MGCILTSKEAELKTGNNNLVNTGKYLGVLFERYVGEKG